MKREGTLHETPFPELLSAILREARTCTLELRFRQLEKRIVFEDGAPIQCSSNLLHETLGKYLVDRGRISESQYQQALAESVSTGKQMGELLVQQGLIAPYDLYKQLQANLAHKILDCFRWSEGKFRVVADAEPSKSALRMNAAQIVLTGVTGFLPFEVVATQLVFDESQRFAAFPEPPPGSRELKLSGKDARLFQALRARPTFAELTKHVGSETEAVHRKLYALVLLGLADFAERLPEVVASAPAPSEPAAPKASEASPATAAPSWAAEVVPARTETPPPPPPPQPTPVSGIAYADEDASTRDALMSSFLEHRSRDPFALLSVTEDAAPATVRKAYLELLDRFAPIRFQNPELREKAEAMAVAWARAFSALADPEQLALWKKRRASAREKAQTTRPSTAEQFRIRTDLLDGRSQFEDGRKRLQAGDAKRALELLEYACDIDPRPKHRAWRAWAMYQSSPDRSARAALEELVTVCGMEGAGDEAFRFAGEIHRALGQLEEAEAAFRKAFKLNPADRASADAIQQILRTRRR